MPRQPCSRWRTDSTSTRPRLEPSRRWKYHSRSPVRSPVRSPSYGASTSAADRAMRARLVHSKYRHPAAYCRLWSVHYRNSTRACHTDSHAQFVQSAASHHRAGTRAPAAPLHSGPDLRRTLSPLALAGWTMDIVCLYTPPPPCPQAQPSPDPPDPGLPIAVRLLVPSSRPRFGPLLACWCRTDGQHDTCHHSAARQIGQLSQGSSGQLMARQIVMEQARPAVLRPCSRTCTHLLHMRGSLDRRMLYVGVAHLVSSNFCPLLEAHARTRKVVRRSAQVVLGLIYPRYPSLPSPPTPFRPSTHPCSTFASLWARGNSAHNVPADTYCTQCLWSSLVRTIVHPA